MREDEPSKNSDWLKKKKGKKSTWSLIQKKKKKNLSVGKELLYRGIHTLQDKLL